MVIYYLYVVVFQILVGGQIYNFFYTFYPSEPIKMEDTNNLFAIFYAIIFEFSYRPLSLSILINFLYFEYASTC